MTRKESFNAAVKYYKDAFFKTGPIDVFVEVILVLKVFNLIATPWVWILAIWFCSFLVRFIIVEIIAAFLRKL